jgi:hypothetical protein
MRSLEPDRDQIEIFVDAIFRHAGTQGYVAVRSFFDDKNEKFRIIPTSLAGGLRFLIDVAEDEARRAANCPRPVVFCPPLAVFSNTRAREQDLAEGLVLSVECDQRPSAALITLEQLLGKPTVVVQSGGQYINGNGEIEDKLHGHWRLAVPACGEQLLKLKLARDIAARVVSGDPSNRPVCHPIRWPGSWHRKAEPTLCRIKSCNPDREIDLASVVKILLPKVPASTTSNGSHAANWRDLVRNGVGEGVRNQTIAQLAGYLLRRRVDPNVVLEIMLAWNASRCRPPLGEDEVTTIINSICKCEMRRRGAQS